MNTEHCIICKKHKDIQHAIFQNQILSVSHMVRNPDGSDNYLGYYMVESMRHFHGMYDATDIEMEEIGRMLKHLSKAIMKVLDAGHVYAFIMGEGLEHFHVHVVARYKNAPHEYWGAAVDEWTDAPRGTIEDIYKLDEKIKNELFKILV